ncbi:MULTISPECIES: hypothetical protein [unclassified Pseudonocardia]|uniref:DUF2795 domain-containing protein n=1 Tax=unclassified Pseudonocardia TaxID=2619320 RepID=UPI00094B532D|nr:hypothetical protein [Pseudonocardia sp. Ae707_Ps1]OLM18993.1 hypothetical protein Ae707Ps1_3252c [Pseudonocardia sp. Ae707_Ps1]
MNGPARRRRLPLPAPAPVPPPPLPPPAPPHVEHLRENLRRVLAGLQWPACRWQVIAEAEAWGVSGVLRNQLAPLPDGRYPSLESILEMLAAVARGRLRTGPPPVPGAEHRHRGDHGVAHVVAHRRIAPRPPVVPRSGRTPA